MAVTRKYILGIDPGGQQCAVVLARLEPEGPVPLDAITVKRAPGERDSLHMGTPRWTQRCVKTLFEMLDKHAVADDELVLVAVETVVVPKPRPGEPIVPSRKWQPLIGTAAILGAISVLFPDVYLVAPDAHDRHDRTDPYWCPPELRGHRPKSFMDGGSEDRHDQLAAWAVIRVALEREPVARSVAEGLVQASRIDALAAAFEALPKGSRRSSDLLAEAQSLHPGVDIEVLAGWVADAVVLRKPDLDREDLIAKLRAA